jgi:DNA polymerase III alpha subunit
LDSSTLDKQPDKRRLQVAGLVICRQMPPTASGVLFITLEDEQGFINLVVWRKTFETYREILLTQSFLRCEGRIQKAKGTKLVHVIVEKVFPLLDRVYSGFPSHDFH